MNLFSRKELLVAFFVLAVASVAYSHCQMPCAIYNDRARVMAMIEDAVTVEKSAKLIGELASKTDAQSENQKTRWVVNKDKHAQDIIVTISNYFLTQRVKPSQKDYVATLKKHHAVIIAAMKAKQHVDIKYAKELKESVKALLPYYPESKH